MFLLMARNSIPPTIPERVIDKFYVLFFFVQFNKRLSQKRSIIICICVKSSNDKERLMKTRNVYVVVGVYRSLD